MKLQKPLLMALMTGLAVLPTATACRKHSELLPVNPPVPAPQPMMLQGSVLDSVSGQPVPGANVTVLKADGSAVMTLTTDAKGSYTLDVSALTVPQLTVRATAGGYGFASVTATLDQASNSAAVPSIRLFKYAGASQSFGPAGGSVTTPPSGESKSGAGVSVNVPAGALAGNTSLTITAVPVSEVPPPPAAAIQTLGVVAITPGGTTFAQPVEAVCPLPLQAAAGRQLSAYRLNPTSNAWELIGAKATVDATGTAVKLPITSTGTYTFTEDIALDPNAAAPEAQEVTEVLPAAQDVLSAAATKVVALKSGSTFVSLTYDTKISYVVKTGSTPVDAWLKNILIQRFGIGGSYTVDYFLAFPRLPANYQRDGRQVNPDKPTETGQWEYRWYFESYNPAVRYVTFSMGSTFTVKAKVEQTSWRLTSQTGWYWLQTSGASGGSGI